MERSFLNIQKISFLPILSKFSQPIIVLKKRACYIQAPMDTYQVLRNAVNNGLTDEANFIIPFGFQPGANKILCATFRQSFEGL